ncbi:unnamed protein product [Rotaria sordida]|uniref:Fork-head domain-containing protein n=1 Tax=Rotaria sordida TaxID=392033 RepID=A0A815EQL6_9BILA|nr:unnamed protein product [Rotaria sordida]CAF1318539.1 unnamed protein product [Rotaria sordida]CAF3733784.1 unnamed protein product [Rotaria sordida]CAF3890376.1 unnamed protein product [Rotaria sordida]
MVKHQSDLHYYHQHQQHHLHHSDSSRSPSICSSSLSPKTSSTTVAITTVTSATATLPTGTSTIASTEVDPQLAKHVEYELGLTKKNGSGTRKNAWGNLSYAELISKAITTSAEQRLTLSEIYDWMIKYVPFFRNKVDRASSAGWKNSIRHNLSLHNRFKRIQSEGTGKSSWWIINPDEKNTSSTISNGTISTTNGIKQTRRRLGQNLKSSSTTPKRLRTPRSLIKSPRILTTTEQQQQQQQQQHQQQESTTQQNPPLDISSVSIYDAQQWTTHLDSDTSVNHLYEQDLYSTSVHTPITNNNSTGGIQATYLFDDIATNYVSNTSSNPTNTNDYSYHHHHHQPQHFHHHHHHQPHTLYQHHHGSNYDIGSNNGYYHHQQPVLNDHHLLPMDTYHTNNGLTYSLQQQQQQQQQIDLNDDQHIYIRAHSASSHSSSSSISPPILTTNNNLASSSSSASSSSNYSYQHKNSSQSSNGYFHPNSNGTLTLYSHHHQHHSDIESLLQLNGIDEENDDDDDLSTLVHHHHGMIDDHQQLSNFLPSNNHQLFSHNEPSTSILRTVLKRPIVDMHNQQV